MAQEVLTKELIDPFGGREDLKNGVVRATSERFKEDPLRVYRVARIAAMLNFEVDKGTIEMMNSLKNELLSLSKERVFTEFRRALETDKPSIFFDVLKKAELLEVHFKEVYDLIGAIQPIKYHPEGDSYNHTMLALDNSAKVTNNVRFRTIKRVISKNRCTKYLEKKCINICTRAYEGWNISSNDNT